MPLKVGIAGCGAATELLYAPALELLQRERRIEVSALFDPDAVCMARISRTLPGAVCVQDYAALLRSEVDLVIVASPPLHHAEQAIQALGFGKAVLCEKPLAISVADAERIVEAAAAARRILAVGLVRRYFPATQVIRAILRGGTLGQIQSVECFEGGEFQWPVRSRAYFDKERARGGVLLDLGPHVFDLLCWWFGSPIGIRYEDDAMGGVEANCAIELRYDRFAIRVRLSRDWGRPNRYLFRGSRGWLGWTVNEADSVDIGFPGADYAAAATLRELVMQRDAPIPGGAAANFHQSFANQLRNVVAAIDGDSAAIVSGAEAIESLRLVEDCYRHRELMPMPWLGETERRAAGRLADG